MNERAKKLHRPSTVKWLALIGSDWLIIAACFWASHRAGTLLAYWVASLIIGNRIHAVGIMGHDGSHYTAAKSHFWNDVLTAGLAFWPTAISLRAYRKFHNKHHRRVGTADDPEFIHKNWASPSFELPMTPLRLAGWLVRDLVGLAVIDLVRLMRLLKPERLADLTAPLIVQALFWSLCLVTRQYWILGLWYFSLCSSFWACFRLRVWIEHVGTLETHRVKLSFWQALLFAPHWTAYHYEHHKWPGVPCWKLPTARTIDDTVPVMSLRQLIDFYLAKSRSTARPAMVAPAASRGSPSASIGS